VRRQKSAVPGFAPTSTKGVDLPHLLVGRLLLVPSGLAIDACVPIGLQSDSAA